MSPEQVYTAEPPQSGMSEIGRLTGVFFEPKKAFADIAARPRWIVPLLILMIASFGMASLYSQKGVMRMSVEQQMAKSPQVQQLPPDQREQRFEFALKFANIVTYAIPLIIPVMYLVMALVLWGIVSGILSAPMRLKQVFAVVTYAQLPSLLMVILTAIVLQLKNPADFNVQNPLMFNPGAFMDPQTSNKFVYSLAGSLDLFTIWVLLLVATGLKAAAGRKLSFGGAMFAVFLPWAVIVLGKAAIAGLTA